MFSRSIPLPFYFIIIAPFRPFSPDMSVVKAQVEVIKSMMAEFHIGSEQSLMLLVAEHLCLSYHTKSKCLPTLFVHQ